ncbi:MAG: hypothetical protein M0Q53_07275 [Prolixibacteraceae bacterium]|jgi:hypothetical protein|nr:hypothetical protein [Prolixibacteraceae bacterium]
MLYNNKKHLSSLKNNLMVSGLVLLLTMSIAVFFQQFVIVLILACLLITGLILNRILNFNYVRFQHENNKVLIRYYALFSVDRSYESVEFPTASLRKVKVKKYLFGLKWDLHLTVKLKQGMASYPAICLSAVPFKERKLLVEELMGVIK